MIIYEVNLSISPNVYDEFIIWLDTHIDKMLSFKGFYSCKTYIVKSTEKDLKKICLHYYIRNKLLLNDYLINHSSTMRKEGCIKFKDNFLATRRILSDLK